MIFRYKGFFFNKNLSILNIIIFYNYLNQEYYNLFYYKIILGFFFIMRNMRLLNICGWLMIKYLIYIFRNKSEVIFC